MHLWIFGGSLIGICKIHLQPIYMHPFKYIMGFLYRPHIGPTLVWSLDFFLLIIIIIWYFFVWQHKVIILLQGKTTIPSTIFVVTLIFHLFYFCWCPYLLTLQGSFVVDKNYYHERFFTIMFLKNFFLGLFSSSYKAILLISLYFFLIFWTPLTLP